MIFLVGNESSKDRGMLDYIQLNRSLINMGLLFLIYIPSIIVVILRHRLATIEIIPTCIYIAILLLFGLLSFNLNKQFKLKKTNDGLYSKVYKYILIMFGFLYLIFLYIFFYANILIIISLLILPFLIVIYLHNNRRKTTDFSSFSIEDERKKMKIRDKKNIGFLTPLLGSCGFLGLAMHSYSNISNKIQGTNDNNSIDFNLLIIVCLGSILIYSLIYHLVIDEFRYAKIKNKIDGEI